jgi:hypothetical protein
MSQLAGFDGVGEAACLMGAIAEWLIGGLAGAAKAQSGTPRQSERATFGIDELEVAFDADGAIVVHGDFGCGQFNLLVDEFNTASRVKPLGCALPLPG